MPEYMLLLYGPESADEAERADRWEMPLWDEVNASLREAGMLVKNGPLHWVATATTVRVRGDETELTDGPFAEGANHVPAADAGAAPRGRERGVRSAVIADVNFSLKSVDVINLFGGRAAFRRHGRAVAGAERSDDDPR